MSEWKYKIVTVNRQTDERLEHKFETRMDANRHHNCSIEGCPSGQYLGRNAMKLNKFISKIIEIK